MAKREVYVGRRGIGNVDETQVFDSFDDAETWAKRLLPASVEQWRSGEPNRQFYAWQLIARREFEREKTLEDCMNDLTAAVDRLEDPDATR